MEDLEVLEIPRHALHARRIVFAHPTTGKQVEVIAPWPAELEAFWEGLAPPPGRT